MDLTKERKRCLSGAYVFINCISYLSFSLCFTWSDCLSFKLYFLIGSGTFSLDFILEQPPVEQETTLLPKTVVPASC